MGIPKAIGRYEILEQLGHGAMGIVYRAQDPAVGRVVAVKTITVLVMSDDQNGQMRERFYREARAAGNLSHPGIVSIYDVGEHEGLPFLVMEFISGRTLAEVLKKGERLPIERVCEIGQQIAEALAYAHRRGVVHRDIKPANILLTSRETEGAERPKIADFGVAKVAEGQTTLTGQMLGTPAFMPPEQITGAPIDGRADLFSLGVVLYWMAVGELPFPGESLTSVSYKVVHTDPPPPQKLNPAIPESLEKVILKCLAKNPSERYQTGEEVSRALAEVIAGTRSPALETFVTPGTMPSLDPEATLVVSSSSLRSAANGATGTMSAAPVSSAAPPAPAATGHKGSGAPLLTSKQYLGLLGLIVLAIALGAGGWFVLWKRVNTARPERALPAAQRDITPPGPPVPVVTVAPATARIPPAAALKTAPQPAAAQPGDLPKGPAKNTAAVVKRANNAVKTQEAAAGVAAAAPAAAPVAVTAAGVDFDPSSLDPKTNSRLKIDAEQTPKNLDFMVEMNGKLYFHRAAGTAADYDNLFVPPGVQEFRVVAQSGAVQKTSNTVSAQFQSKKRRTLKVELRVLGAAPNDDAMPEGLYPDTQIILSLK